MVYASMDRRKFHKAQNEELYMEMASEGGRTSFLQGYVPYS